MDPADHLVALRRSADALVATAAGRLDVPVPSCPGWTMADLVEHVGSVWAWAERIVATGSRADQDGLGPDSRDERVLLTWAGHQADRLVETLRGADPDTDCWTFGMPRTRRFWIRRQALETVLHAWDAHRAAGLPATLDGAVAADGLDELLTIMVPRSLRRAPGSWRGESVHVHRTDGDGDGDGEWVLVLGPEGAVEVDRAHRRADLALRGPADALWLWCANRVPQPARPVEVVGDRALADRWRDEIAF